MLFDWWKRAGRAVRLIVVALVLVAVIWALIFVRDWVIGTSKVEARLGTEQSGAAIKSGQDAVETVGENERRADETDGKVTGVQNDVDQADDAAGADRAGRDGLCQQFGLCDEK